MLQKPEIKSLIEEKLTGTDQFLVDIKLSPNKLTVFIDKPEGIRIDECTSLSRYLLEQLEPSGFLESHEVEVGSPGMDAPLLVPRQYMRRLGRELKVILNDGRESKGVLEEVFEDGIAVRSVITRKEAKKKIVTEELHRIPFHDIKEAKLVINYKF